MGDMADYDMYDNINNAGRVEYTIYKCGYCGKKFGTDKKQAYEHVNNCEADNKGEAK